MKKKSVFSILSFYFLQIIILILFAFISQILFRNSEILSVVFRYALALLSIFLINKFWLKQEVNFGFHNVSIKDQYSSYFLTLLIFVAYFYSFRPNDLAQPLTDVLCFSIGPGIFEEYVNRGLILTALINKFKEKGYIYILMSVLISSFLFGLMHFINFIFMAQSLPNTIVQVINATAFGFIASAIYIRTKNIFLVMFIHFFTDFSVGILNTIWDNNYALYMLDILFILFTFLLLKSKNKINVLVNNHIN
ncbi:CPBP family intramembrane metalloprotease [Apilactobacillus apisilvae]|uniref:CPBP family intramembrane metalloprotease n=1 Tax=Apilactobacillus apisilvae TaxID=2923364 RepID=A0ABY4PGU3_9LACO|nr:CPBP family intramembrane glutamic endopeptidase [Apilactobacillus apisilvae]UQS84696.1 CPBP family intramembrane metalloprotease [Apilactobacillus apisilvae]